jgi:hypothetical protein
LIFAAWLPTVVWRQFVLPAVGAAERAIDKEVVVAATLDEAWESWTTRAGIVSFFAPDAEVDARSGGAFHVEETPRRGTAPARQRQLTISPPRMRCPRGGSKYRPPAGAARATEATPKRTLPAAALAPCRRTR